jgi:hypothetical protein
MKDYKNKSDSGNTDKINMNEKYELEYWCKKLWVSPERLKETIIAVGAKVKDVEQRLQR